MRQEPYIPHCNIALTGPLQAIEVIFLDKRDHIEDWFSRQWIKTPPPLYSSVDLRNSGFKISPVDTNLFPAGFNNLNPDVYSMATAALKTTIAQKCGDVTEILLLSESHTRNISYFENLATFVELLMQTGFTVRIGTLRADMQGSETITTTSGKTLTLEPLFRQGDRIGVSDYFPDVVILNNDFSEGIPDLLRGIVQPMLPPIELTWSLRLKSTHFEYYQSICSELALLLNCDPWLFSLLFDKCPEINFIKREGQECLYARAQGLLRQIQYKYDAHNIKQQPFIVIKADAGTYGMAVMMVTDPEQILSLNRKQRTRMSSLKGGKMVTKAILQEGVHSYETVGAQNSTAEPVVYVVGLHVIGGFYRAHDGKNAQESLNAPGMHFTPFPLLSASEYKDPSRVDRFYSYSVIARLATLAAAKEKANIV